MDQARFDAIVRGMAQARDRRATLGLALRAAAVAIVGARHAVSAQEACPGGCPEDFTCVDGACARPCQTNHDCRSKKDDPCISNSCVDGFCVQAIIDCLPGYDCCDDGCCAKACVADADCAVLEPCRWGRCGEDGICAFTQVDPCLVCSSDLDCAGEAQNTVCCSGVCQRPCPEGTLLGKGCECHADNSAVLNGLVVRDDASGSTPENQRQPRRRR